MVARFFNLPDSQNMFHCLLRFPIFQAQKTCFMFAMFPNPPNSQKHAACLIGFPIVQTHKTMLRVCWVSQSSKLTKTCFIFARCSNLPNPYTCFMFARFSNLPNSHKHASYLLGFPIFQIHKSMLHFC